MPSYVYGIHAVESAIQAKKVDHLYVLKERQTHKVNQLLEAAQKNKVPVTFAELGWLNKKLGDVNHQGVAANLLTESTQTKSLEDFLTSNNKNLFFLILDEVQDPHNLGACFRIASAFNLTGIIAPKNNSVGITPAVIKVASGAVDHVPFFQVTNLSRTLDLLKENNFFIYAADGYSDVSIYDEKFSGNVALVMGSEGKGIRRLTKDKCDLTFSIPMQGSIDSLNVSVATGICVSEIRRKLG
jgi:23S rRNA (guanosine2251-2'-O)-methyltransferase